MPKKEIDKYTFKISEACIDCMGAGLKKGFSTALKFMRERGL